MTLRTRCLYSRNFFVSFGLPDRFIRLYNLSLFLIRRRISWFIHGKPSRVPALLVGINLSMPCAGLLANISHFLDICGSKVIVELRLKIPHSLFKLVPICFFIKGGVTWDLFSLARYGIYKYPDYVVVTKT